MELFRKEDSLRTFATPRWPEKQKNQEFLRPDLAKNESTQRLTGSFQFSQAILHHSHWFTSVDKHQGADGAKIS